jgi:hypothetical protein
VIVLQETPLGEIWVLFETTNPVPKISPNYNAGPTQRLPIMRLGA